MAALLLALALLAGIALIPLGLPGIWLQLAALAGYGWATGWRASVYWALGIVAGLALLGEVLEWTLGRKYARRYGGSGSAEWGAVVGGMVGAMAGIPIPVVGSVIGAFVGAFAGAAVFELAGRTDWRSSVRVGWGALLGRVAAAAAKCALAVAAAAVALLSTLG
ncbi:MAG: hypothetical protein JWM27_3192 [Gemmatimonadetes bacterium]|nr:hypothetical protein [Gemmatimonadota bacterium]